MIGANAEIIKRLSAMYMDIRRRQRKYWRHKYFGPFEGCKFVYTKPYLRRYSPYYEFVMQMHEDEKKIELIKTETRKVIKTFYHK